MPSIYIFLNNSFLSDARKEDTFHTSGVWALAPDLGSLKKAKRVLKDMHPYTNLCSCKSLNTHTLYVLWSRGVVCHGSSLLF